MDFRTLNRNPDTILSALKSTQSDALVTSRPLRIYIPAFYAERGLAEIGGTIEIVGFCAWVIGSEYDFTTIPAMMTITPSYTNTVKGHDGVEYFEFVFEAGAVVMPVDSVPVVDIMSYKVYNVIHSKAKIPWFTTYDTFSETFANADRYAGVSLGKLKDVLEVLCALQSRSPHDTNVFYRNFIQNRKQLETDPPDYIPIASIVHAATGTMSRLGGRNFVDGLTSALANPHDTVEDLERVYRQ